MKRKISRKAFESVRKFFSNPENRELIQKLKDAGLKCLQDDYCYWRDCNRTNACVDSSNG